MGRYKDLPVLEVARRCAGDLFRAMKATSNSGAATWAIVVSTPVSEPMQ